MSLVSQPHQRFCLAFVGAIALSLSLNPRHPVSAQQVYIQPEATAPAVYERLPATFPQANSYVRRESGAVDADNTLLSRLIAYHIYVKNRSPFFRLDWKLTLADYLGVHEAPSPTQYPSNRTLTENPVVGDRELIRALNRRERDELVQALVTVFNAERRQPTATTTEEPGSRAPSPEAIPAPGARSPRLPAPGAADLLR
ncbi:MAG: hypothetical protein HC838_10845 [Spirulinaceae cyanobacterium RM2_2_10]|nr:hypothetical protein [Spirulinaceae cyanobacterium SM2_1_0]NJO20426.1 hypothetical protein [Spirulinaceae cyanobacterium RM2_2_10]